MKSPTYARYDVAILGTGVAGSTLGAILARHDLRVLLVDAGSHPRFAIGESTIPYTTSTLHILAERYDVPELAALANFKDTSEHVSTTCGHKQNFGFVYHQEGKPPNRELANQFVLPTWYRRSEAHWFRQDIDAHLFNLAVRYGAVPKLNTRVSEIDVDPARGVTLRTATGEVIEAKFLVDATGFQSVLANRFGLREQPTRARTHSRTLFTHMVGVQPFDEVTSVPYNPPTRWHDGTLHHVFDGGWLWVIPFDNHESSRNPLCSVGLTLTGQAALDEREAPEREFEVFLQRFPAIAEQFRAAKSVRPWVSTGRLQYSASKTVGDRFCLTAQAAGTIDALFSRGLANSLQTVHSLAWRLIDAARDGDWSTEKFAYVDVVQQYMFDVHDDLAYSSYVAFRNYSLWNAVVRVWHTFSFYTDVVLEHALARFTATGDDRYFRAQEKGDSELATTVRELLSSTRATCQAVDRGEMTPAAAAETILGRLEKGQYWPDFMRYGEPDIKYVDLKPEQAQPFVHWSRTEAPRCIRECFS